MGQLHRKADILERNTQSNTAGTKNYSTRFRYPKEGYIASKKLKAEYGAGQWGSYTESPAGDRQEYPINTSTVNG